MRPRGGQLELRWRPSGRRAASEFVVEWSSGAHLDWQRESRGTTNTTVRGDVLVSVPFSPGEQHSASELSTAAAVAAAAPSATLSTLVLVLKVSSGSQGRVHL